jgi:Holliday junction resolvase RusA-like endonuclease
MVIFRVDGNPLPKQSARVTKHGAYIPARIKAWQDQIAWAAKAAMAGEDPYTGDVALETIFYRKDTRRCDIDNLNKAVWDACNGIVWEDDSQVVEVKSYKYTGQSRPGVHITVWRLCDSIPR